MTSWSWSGSWTGTRPTDFGPPPSLIGDTDLINMWDFPPSSTTTSTPTTTASTVSAITTSTATSTTTTATSTTTTATMSQTIPTTSFSATTTNTPTYKPDAVSTEPTVVSASSNDSTASANALKSEAESTFLTSNITTAVLGGVLSTMLISALLVGLLIYRHRKRNRSLNDDRFGDSNGTTHNLNGSPSTGPLVGAGFASGAVAAATIYPGQDETLAKHKDDQFDYQNNRLDNDVGMAAYTITAGTTANVFSVQPLSPPLTAPAHTVSAHANRSMFEPRFGVAAEAATVTVAATTNHFHGNNDSCTEIPQGFHISPPICVPDRYDTSTPVGEYAYRDSTVSIYRDPGLPNELGIIAGATLPPESPGQDMVIEMAQTNPTTDTKEFRGSLIFNPSVNDTMDLSMATAVVPAGQLEISKDKELTSVNTEQSQLEGQIDMPQLNDPTAASDSKRLSHVLSSNLQPAGLIIRKDEEENQMTKVDVSSQAGTLSTLTASGFDPEVMFGIPAAADNQPSQKDNNENYPMSGYDDEYRANVTTSAIRTPVPRAPSFVRCDSAFFPDDAF